MHKNTPHSSFHLLSTYLTPKKSPSQLQALKNHISNTQDWGPLLYEANQQMCTPLWYQQLHDDNLLELLPNELQEFLLNIHELNRSRNLQMKSEVEAFLSTLEREGIDSILLKGAATYYDNLYPSLGCRFMGDADILVPHDKASYCNEILIKQGFQEIEDAKAQPEGFATDERHHQLPRMQKPNTPSVIEVHFKASYAQAGRCLDIDSLWNSRRSIEAGATRSSVLSPTNRIILNTAHALLPNREYIYGRISLMQLLEFSRLYFTYEQEIDWNAWHSAAKKNNIETAFYTYAYLANQLTNTEIDIPNRYLKQSKKQYRRILSRATPSPSRITQLKNSAFYYSNLPNWIWNNLCYAPGLRNLPARLRLLFIRIYDKSSWEKI